LVVVRCGVESTLRVQGLTDEMMAVVNAQKLPASKALT
jgi:hypothetical protein